MKKLVTILTIGMLALTGCSTQEDAKPKDEQEPVKEAVVKEPEFDWSDSELAKKIPVPKTDETNIEANDENVFYVYVNGDEDAFDSYIKECKEAGFTVDAQELDGTGIYAAYNKEGDHLGVVLNGTQYEVTVRKSKINGELKWPSTGISKLIPKPDSIVGTIGVDSSDQLTAYVGEITKEEFKAYVDDCISSGFEYDYNKGETYFDGRNKDGDYLHLSYEGIDAMNISLISMELMDDNWKAPTN